MGATSVIIVPVILALITGVLRASGDSTPEGCFLVESKGNASHAVRRTLENAEHEFYQLIRWSPDATFPPVQVTLCVGDEMPSLAVNAIEGGGPCLTLRLSPELTDPRNAPLLADSLLLRQFYGRTAPAPGSSVPRYPDWVLRGLGSLLLETKATSTGAIPDSPELEAFLTERVPDPDETSLIGGYDRMASLLLRAGLHDDAGRKAFRDWVGEYQPTVSSTQPPPWVGGWEMRPVERRWVLSFHSAGGDDDGDASRIASANATLNAYESLIRSSLEGKQSLAEVRREKGGAFRLGQLEERLAALRLQSNPLVLPLIDETIVLVRTSKKLSPSALAKEEHRLRDEVEVLRSRSVHISDYLNWYQATRSSQPSGIFQKFLSSHPPDIKKGPLGRVVDAVEARGW